MRRHRGACNGEHRGAHSPKGHTDGTDEAARTAAMRAQLEVWLKSVANSLNGADYTR